MQVRFLALFRDLTGESNVRWHEPAETLVQLIEGLASRYGVEFRSRVLDGDDLAQGVIVLVNGRDARQLGSLKCALSPQDTVLFLPLAGGG